MNRKYAATVDEAYFYCCKKEWSPFMGAPLWEPLTRGNPSQALRVSEDSGASPTPPQGGEVKMYIMT